MLVVGLSVDAAPVLYNRLLVDVDIVTLLSTEIDTPTRVLKVGNKPVCRTLTVSVGGWRGRELKLLLALLDGIAVMLMPKLPVTSVPSKELAKRDFLRAEISIFTYTYVSVRRQETF